GTKLLNVTGGVSGTGNLILQNNSATAAGITIATTAVNNIGTITNSGAGTGDSTISGGVGANVTGVTENSTTSSLNIITTALTVNAGGTTLTNSNASGSAILNVSSAVAGTGNLVLNNNSAVAGGIVLSNASINNVGTI